VAKMQVTNSKGGMTTNCVKGKGVKRRKNKLLK
jgi:hypothetical protein